MRPIVLTIGQISGGRAPNVIADQVRMAGTVRSLHPETHAHLPEWIESLVTNVCSTYNAKCQVKYRRGVPSVQNDQFLTRLVEEAGLEAWGQDRVLILSEPSMGPRIFPFICNRPRGQCSVWEWVLLTSSIPPFTIRNF